MRGKPAAVRGMARIGSTDGGWLSRIDVPRINRWRLPWEDQPPRPAPSNYDAYDAFGFFVGSVAADRLHRLVRPDLLRKDVSIPAPACLRPRSGLSARAAILVIRHALGMVSDHGSARANANPPSPVTSVSALICERIPEFGQPGLGFNSPTIKSHAGHR